MVFVQRKMHTACKLQELVCIPPVHGICFARCKINREQEPPRKPAEASWGSAEKAPNGLLLWPLCRKFFQYFEIGICISTCWVHAKSQNLEERLLDEAQVRVSYTPPFWGLFA